MPEVGQPFNPFRLFTGIFIPEALVRSNLVSPGAKMAYGRLARYAGQDGRCFPAVGKLAQEIGVGERQAQKYLAELENAKLIRRGTRFSGRAQTSNSIEFLWHPLFQDRVNDRSGEGVNDHSPGGVNDSSPKESQIEESHLEETIDSDCPATNRKGGDSRLEGSSLPPKCKQYPSLREALALYMMAGSEDEKVYPKPRHVVDVMDAAAGATEDEVLGCLSYLRDERGLKPGTRSGPRHFSWFPTVVGDYFLRQRERQQPSNPTSAADVGFSQAQFDSMTDAIEI
jgi:hypothetical protein